MLNLLGIMFCHAHEECARSYMSAVSFQLGDMARFFEHVSAVCAGWIEMEK